MQLSHAQWSDSLFSRLKWRWRHRQSVPVEISDGRKARGAHCVEIALSLFIVIFSWQEKFCDSHSGGPIIATYPRENHIRMSRISRSGP